MITAEIRINSTLIGWLYVRNKQDLEPGECLYDCEYYTPETGDLMKFTVIHKQSDGAAALMALCFQLIAERTK